MYSNIFVSIIVPVYNTEKYLPRCIDSLVAQTYENIEIILVDDGSIDDSGKICDEYAEKFSHVKVIHKKNGGLSSARKVGVENATGEFVSIVDSDDWIDPDMIAHMLETKLERNVDLVICSYCREYKGNSFPVHIFERDIAFYGEQYTDKVYRRLYGPMRDELSSPEKLDSLGSACMKLYSREILLQADFVDTKEVGSAEDVLLNMSILGKLSSAAYIDKPYYHYRKGSGSTAKYRPLLAMQWEVLYGYMTKYLEKFSLEESYRKALMNRRAIGIIGLGLNEIAASDSVYAKSRRLKNILDQPKYREALEILQMQYFPMKWKVFFGLTKYKFYLLFAGMLTIIATLRKRISG